MWQSDKGDPKLCFLKSICREFPGGPAIKTQRFHYHGPGFDPWLGN